MERGDISNLPAPAIVIDIDELLIRTYKPEGLLAYLGELGLRKFKAEVEVKRYRRIDSAYPLLENLFYKGLLIYLFAQRPWFYKKPLEKLLEPFIFSKLFVGGVGVRESLLGRRNVHWYYYSVPEHCSLVHKDKEKHVNHFSEIDLW